MPLGCRFALVLFGLLAGIGGSAAADERVFDLWLWERPGERVVAIAQSAPHTRLSLAQGERALSLASERDAARAFNVMTARNDRFSRRPSTGGDVLWETQDTDIDMVGPSELDPGDAFTWDIGQRAKRRVERTLVKITTHDAINGETERRERWRRKVFVERGARQDNGIGSESLEAFAGRDIDGSPAAPPMQASDFDDLPAGRTEFERMIVIRNADAAEAARFIEQTLGLDAASKRAMQEAFGF